MVGIPNVFLLLAVAFIARLILLGYGEWQDATMIVKYTDVDYHVYMDAAKHVVNGQSPFDRHTYRYTPLIAYLMVPSVLFHPAIGKLMFVCSDIAVGWMIYKMSLNRKVSHSTAAKLSMAWLFNPISMNISTRGNADTLACLLVIGTLYLISSSSKNSLQYAAIIYGLSVHFRIFPIVFAPTLVFFIDKERFPTKVEGNKFGPWLLRFQFGFISGAVFFLLASLFYALYGYQFLFESYLYHFVRADTRHNFSPFFYTLYLTSASGAAKYAGLLAFGPHVLLQAATVYRYHKDLVFAVCLQTITFVAFNKVCTAQYFLWYISMLPLALPSTNLRLLPTGLVLIASWFAAELHWLYWAYYLEFQGQATFFPLWMASLQFFLVNVALIGFLMKSYQGIRLFRNGKLQPIQQKAPVEKKRQ